MIGQRTKFGRTGSALIMLGGAIINIVIGIARGDWVPIGIGVFLLIMAWLNA